MRGRPASWALAAISACRWRVRQARATAGPARREDSIAYFVSKDDLHRLAMVAALIGSKESSDDAGRTAGAHER